MKTTFISFAFLALIASSTAVRVQLAAGASTDPSFNVAGAFGALAATSYASVSFTNGNTAATINFDPVLLADFNAGLTSAYGNTDVVAGSKLGVGIRVTADATGSGTLTVSFSALFAGLAASASQFVLISTPVATASGSAAEAVYVPPTSSSFGGSNSLSWSISFNRNYVILALSANANVGATVQNAYQATFNTTSRVVANAYTQFSASTNAKSSTNTNTGSTTSTSTGNPFVQFASSSEAQLNVAQFYFGGSAAGKTYTAPSGTVANVGGQFSINRNSGSFNGNITYSSNGRGTYTADQAAGFSWYKAASGTASASGWTKIASTSTVDASGNLVVTAQQSGEFSEWTVARSSASSVAAGVLALVAVLALVF